VELGIFYFFQKEKEQKSALKIHVHNKKIKKKKKHKKTKKHTHTKTKTRQREKDRRGKEGDRLDRGPKGASPSCGPKKSMNKINDKGFQFLACFFFPIFFSFC
jgi:hypothetical protein